MASTVGRSPATFSFFELLDSTFRIYRANFATYVGLTAVILIPIAVISLVLNYSNLNSFQSTASSRLMNSCTQRKDRQIQ